HTTAAARQVAQEQEFVDGERPGSAQLAFRVGRGEFELTALVVAEAKFRRPDRKPLGAFHEPGPIRPAPKFAISDDGEAEGGLALDDIADDVVLQPPERFGVDAPGGMVAKRLTQSRRAQQAADMIGTEWGATQLHPGNLIVHQTAKIL